jgi:lysophospholipase L1-like esterase
MKLQVRRLTVIKIVFYATTCAALSVSFFVGDFRRITSSLQFWGMLAEFQAGLLASLIPFRNVALKQISNAVTALVVMNLFSPLLNFIGEPVTTLQPNLRLHVRIAGGAAFGVDGVQTITTDSKGYRTNTPIDYARKDPDTVRIVAIGGSTTEDIYLDDAKTWTSLLAARLSKALNRPVEMINTGVSGLRGWHHLLTLQESKKFSPDIAVVMMGINDWNRHIKLAQRSTTHGVIAYIGRFSIEETVLFRAIRMARAFAVGLVKPAAAVREETLAYRRSRHDSLSLKDVRSFQVSEVSKDYQTSVDGIAAECRKRRMLCFFVDQPTAYDSAIEPALKHRLWMTPPDEQYTLSLDDMANIAKFYNAWLQREAEKDGVEFCGVAKDVAPTTEFFFDDCHFNERGAQRIASLVAACMEPRLRAHLPASSGRRTGASAPGLEPRGQAD